MKFRRVIQGGDIIILCRLLVATSRSVSEISSLGLSKGASAFFARIVSPTGIDSGPTPSRVALFASLNGYGRGRWLISARWCLLRSKETIPTHSGSSMKRRRLAALISVGEK